VKQSQQLQVAAHYQSLARYVVTACKTSCKVQFQYVTINIPGWQRENTCTHRAQQTHLYANP
jgi:hypothetical protein